MGYAEEPLPDPQQFLKKNTTESKGATASLPAPRQSHFDDSLLNQAWCLSF